MKVFVILALCVMAVAAVDKPVVPTNSTVVPPPVVAPKEAPKEARTGRYLRLVGGNYYDTYERVVIYSPYFYNRGYNVESVYVDTVPTYPYYNRQYYYTY